MSDTSTIDRLFLELSQFTTATTARERNLERYSNGLQRQRDELLALIRLHVDGFDVDDQMRAVLGDKP
ncbi:MAG: hypothetical protein KKD44_26030 [Proteobacteria bacterium]|nr:hypothetical protein [Pseudomonadota bacterium]